MRARAAPGPRISALHGIDAALAQIGKAENAMQRAIAHQARQRACAMACSGRQLRHHRFPSAALCFCIALVESLSRADDSGGLVTR